MRGQSLSEYAMTIVTVATALFAMRIFVTHAARTYLDNAIVGRLADGEDVAPNQFGRDKTYEVAGAPTTGQGQEGSSFERFRLEGGGVATREFHGNVSSSFEEGVAQGD
jgi:hypothetical protein